MKRSFSVFAGITVAQKYGTKCLRIAGMQTPFFYVAVGSSGAKTRP